MSNLGFCGKGHCRIPHESLVDLIGQPSQLILSGLILHGFNEFFIEELGGIDAIHFQQHIHGNDFGDHRDIFPW